IQSGQIHAGDNLLAAGKAMPSPATTINGQTFNWSRIAFAGGSHLVSGTALFTRFQPMYDPRILWVRQNSLCATVTYWPLPAPLNTFVQSITQGPMVQDQVLITPGVVWATSLAGSTSYLSHTGLFIPTATLSSWLINGSGVVLNE